jgi:hypothetical protein
MMSARERKKRKGFLSDLAKLGKEKVREAAERNHVSMELLDEWGRDPLFVAKVEKAFVRATLYNFTHGSKRDILAGEKLYKKLTGKKRRSKAGRPPSKALARDTADILARNLCIEHGDAAIEMTKRGHNVSKGVWRKRKTQFARVRKLVTLGRSQKK